MKRSDDQNKALHLYFRMLAEDLNAAGLDMKEVLKPSVDIPWTEEAVKEFLWKGIQKAYLGKKSTTELETHEVTQIYEILNRHLGERFGIATPFPSKENVIDALKAKDST